MTAGTHTTIIQTSSSTPPFTSSSQFPSVNLSTPASRSDSTRAVRLLGGPVPRSVADASRLTPPKISRGRFELETYSQINIRKRRTNFSVLCLQILCEGGHGDSSEEDGDEVTHGVDEKDGERVETRLRGKLRGWSSSERFSLSAAHTGTEHAYGPESCHVTRIDNVRGTASSYLL